MVINYDFSKISNFYKKKSHATFEPLWMPNFMPSFRKIPREVLEKSRRGRMHGQTGLIL